MRLDPDSCKVTAAGGLPVDAAVEALAAAEAGAVLAAADDAGADEADATLAAGADEAGAALAAGADEAGATLAAGVLAEADVAGAPLLPQALSKITDAAIGAAHPNGFFKGVFLSMMKYSSPFLFLFLVLLALSALGLRCVPRRNAANLA